MWLHVDLLTREKVAEATEAPVQLFFPSFLYVIYSIISTVAKIASLMWFTLCYIDFRKEKKSDKDIRKGWCKIQKKLEFPFLFYMYLMLDKCTLTEYMNNHIEKINHYLWLGYTVYTQSS